MNYGQDTVLGLAAMFEQLAENLQALAVDPAIPLEEPEEDAEPEGRAGDRLSPAEELITRNL